MKTFEQLTPEQQEEAIQKCTNDVLKGVVEGYFTLGLDENIEAAAQKAESMRTPWFIHEYIMDDPELALAIRTLGKDNAEKSLYPERNEFVVYLKSLRKAQ